MAFARFAPGSGITALTRLVATLIRIMASSGE